MTKCPCGYQFGVDCIRCRLEDFTATAGVHGAIIDHIRGLWYADSLECLGRQIKADVDGKLGYTLDLEKMAAIRKAYSEKLEELKSE